MLIKLYNFFKFMYVRYESSSPVRFAMKCKICNSNTCCRFWKSKFNLPSHSRIHYKFAAILSYMFRLCCLGRLVNFIVIKAIYVHFMIFSDMPLGLSLYATAFTNYLLWIWRKLCNELTNYVTWFARRYQLRDKVYQNCIHLHIFFLAFLQIIFNLCT